jgi:hypothetical protein
VSDPYPNAADRSAARISKLVGGERFRREGCRYFCRRSVSIHECTDVVSVSVSTR